MLLRKIPVPSVSECYKNLSTRPKVFRDFFLRTQLSQTADESAADRPSAFICGSQYCKYLKTYGQVLMTVGLYRNRCFKRIGVTKMKHDPAEPEASEISPALFWLSTRPKVFRDFFLRKQLSQTADGHGWTLMSPRQTGIFVYLCSSAVPHMQIPENIWPGTYTQTNSCQTSSLTRIWQGLYWFL